MEVTRKVKLLGQWIECLIEKHKLIRRAIVVWAVVLTTLICLRITNVNTIGQLDINSATVLVPVIALLHIIIVQYIHQRGKPDGTTQRQGIPEREDSDSR